MKCGEVKPATTDHFPRHARKVSGLGSWCRECHRADARRRHWLRFSKMASQEWIAEVKQDIRECIICGSTHRLTLDHDHMLQRIRGILCTHCNLGLGHFRDDPELLDFAAVYLRQILK